MPRPTVTLVYDGACPLCRSLADFVVARGQGVFRAEAHAAADGGDEAPADIALVTVDGRWEGADAWRELLARHPDARQWHWLAARLGLAEPAAQALRGTAKALRALRCPRCGPKGKAPRA